MHRVGQVALYLCLVWFSSHSGVAASGQADEIEARISEWIEEYPGLAVAVAKQDEIV